ncbi:hypothetical protein VTK73DRAFT_2715 [Phialemonium thermophilum]|uniref:Uncharacterized protein n=1 Tax=Phialemonium thermophilum TaxID=223376 RepID=A0ABR3VPI0_9PEZI
MRVTAAATAELSTAATEITTTALVMVSSTTAAASTTLVVSTPAARVVAPTTAPTSTTVGSATASTAMGPTAATAGTSTARISHSFGFPEGNSAFGWLSSLFFSYFLFFGSRFVSSGLLSLEKLGGEKKSEERTGKWFSERVQSEKGKRQPFGDGQQSDKVSAVAGDQG